MQFTAELLMEKEGLNGLRTLKNNAYSA